MADKKPKKKPTLKDQISDLNNQVNDEKDKFLRLFAEFENYRKRTSKERLDLFKTASQELMTALLPISDDMDRALLQAQLNQAGFTQAQGLASQAFGQQTGLAQLQPGLASQAIGMAQGLGQQDLAYRQAVLDAQRQASQMAAYEPIERLARFGQGLTGVGGGLGSVQTTTGTPAPVQSPLAGALQAGIGAFSLGKLFGF